MKERMKTLHMWMKNVQKERKEGGIGGGLINCFFSFVNKFEDQIKSDDEKKYTKKRNRGLNFH
jgi:hypothetical protein